MTATENITIPATAATWAAEMTALKARYRHVREPILVALNILLHDHDVSIKDAKARAAERGTKITAASINGARNLISKMDGAPSATTVPTAAAAVADAPRATTRPGRRDRPPEGNQDAEALIRGVVAKIQGQGNAESERVRDAVRKAIAILMKVRCVRIDVGADEPWLLFTSLRRADATLPQLQDIYHLRWAIEEFYKLIKSDGFSLRQMHAKSVLGVEQEIVAQLTLTAISRLLAANAVAEHLPVPQALSPKAGVLAIANNIVRIMLCDDPEQRLAHHASLLRRLARRRLKLRPGRSSPRISFKPSPRWNSKGKVGG